MKFLLIAAIIILSVSSCSTVRPVSKPSSDLSSKENGSPRFIENVKLTPYEGISSQRAGGSSKVSKSQEYTSYEASEITESLTSLQFKYGIMMNVAVEELTNLKLLEAIDEWYGARYKYGGNTKAGIDCSAFVSTIMTTVFGLGLPRTAREQYATSQRIRKEELQEGDLVFFNTTGGISHVGIYLNSDKFVHASTSGGVMISDLTESYFSGRYAGAGRVL